MRSLKSNSSGFTLIELVVTVAIVGILASVAYPSYISQVRKAVRAELAKDILECAAVLERRYTLNLTYTSDACVAINTANNDYAITIALPGGNCISNGNSNCFTVNAAPIAGTRMASDTDCTAFSYTHLGAKTATKAGPTDNTVFCWRTS